MRKLSFCLLAYMLLLAGCASNSMNISDSAALDKPSASESRIVFMRSSFVGSAINASLFDVTSGEPKFIGIISNETKVPYDTTPGHHVFMVVSETADFMLADLSENKTYYSIITPRMGAWKARFSLHPIKNDGTTKHNTGTENFKEWIASTKVARKSPKAEQWFKNNLPDIKQKYTEVWPRWQQKPAHEKDVYTVKESDGI